MSNATSKPARRIGIHFIDEECVVMEIQRLRDGHDRAGNWTLAQVCDHLDKGIQARMKAGPFPPNTPEQDARKAMFATILATGQLPDGIEAPDFMQPPATCDDASIDACIVRLREFATFNGPIAPHRLFGHLAQDEARRLNLIHCARHLSFLIPISK